MAGKFKHLRKPLFVIAAVIWIGYVFLAKSIPEGVMTIILLLLMLIAMSVEF